MLQFIDLDEENAFVEKEFLTSRNSTVLTLATTLAIILMFHDKLERENPVQIFTCELCSFLIVLQLLLRVGLSCLSDQCFAAKAYRYAIFAIVVLQILSAIYVERTTGLALIDAESPSSLFLVLGLLGVFFQALIAFNAAGFNAPGCIVQLVVCITLFGVHMYLHVPQPDRLLLTEVECFATYCLMAAICAGLSVAQTHSRRTHIAQVAHLAEELAKQRDRLQYALRFAEKRAAGELGSVGACPSTVSSSAADELDASLKVGGARATLDEFDDVLYALRPQFYREQQSGVPSEAPVRYLLPSERTRHEVIARGGRLVDRHGKVLAPGRALTGMFVLDRGGALLANFDDTDERGFHHSSFVAGEPVAAAGCITVRDGRILSLSNESGHYIPAPSSLHRVMRKLSELGVSELPSVRLEVVRNEAYDNPAVSCAAAQEVGPSARRRRSPSIVKREYE